MKKAACVLVIFLCVITIITPVLADDLGTLYADYVVGNYITGGADLKQADALAYSSTEGPYHVWYPTGLQRVIVYDAGNCAIVEGRTSQADTFLRTCAAFLIASIGATSVTTAYADLLRLYIAAPKNTADTAIRGAWIFRVTFDASSNNYQFIIMKR